MPKKKDAHHGGAWKVAYADFVTAMMALFIVLWICKENPKLASIIAGSFRKPLFTEQAGGPDSSVGIQAVLDMLDTETLSAEEILERLETISTEIQKLLNTDDPEKNLAKIEISGSRMKLTLFDRTNKPLFEKDTDRLTRWGLFLMEGLSWIIEHHKLSVMIDGHTAASPKKQPPAEDGLWELSLDRANRCRRELVNNALDPRYFFRITGFGESRPLPSLSPEDPANARITLTLTLSDLNRTKGPASATLSKESAPAIPPAPSSQAPPKASEAAGTPKR